MFLLSMLRATNTSWRTCKKECKPTKRIGNLNHPYDSIRSSVRMVLPKNAHRFISFQKWVFEVLKLQKTKRRKISSHLWCAPRDVTMEVDVCSSPGPHDPGRFEHRRLPRFRYTCQSDDSPGGQEKMLRIRGPNLSVKNKLGEKKLFNKSI